ncbi:heme peroxidase [Suhomyces tanzawaensis NRRL Y-17324]|uniref:Peroxidase n=1 Tax=Suhomyces tanzawaensis NRRL Y-17324 TaxID=984487 RepID=A0A1E4SBZ2_9ASCO|nr:heme peroxidase [Suhomyces tanzawaensis NRRL Y-17324]ODV77034.1 heme peroxidase [Suhomyces tanzawaensis NRRL Y-17324]
MSTIALKPLRVARTSKQFKNGSRFLAAGLVGSSALAAYFYNKNNNNSNGSNGSKALGLMAGSAIVNHAAVPEGKGFQDYQQVYNDIAEKVADNLEFDQNSGFYGMLCRLAWHSSGTYKKSDNTGGSYPGTMMYSTEAFDGANKGLEVGRDFLMEFKDKYPWISRGDLWTLGGVVAVQESGGPKIPWRPGRKDSNDKKVVPENGRLPDASQEDPQYVRGVFSRMGFNDRETVALIGAHCLGRCHSHNSGFDGPWGPSFNMFTNDFYVRLLQGWHIRDWNGNRQYEDDETKSFMMLPADMALKHGSYFVKYVKEYAEDQDLFFKDFSKAYSTLLELGITFPKNSKPFEFKTLDEQDDE